MQLLNDKSSPLLQVKEIKKMFQRKASGYRFESEDNSALVQGTLSIVDKGFNVFAFKPTYRCLC